MEPLLWVVIGGLVGFGTITYELKQEKSSMNQLSWTGDVLLQAWGTGIGMVCGLVVGLMQWVLF